MTFDISGFLPFVSNVGTAIINIFRSFTVNFGSFSINGFALVLVCLVADYIIKNLWEE